MNIDTLRQEIKQLLIGDLSHAFEKIATVVSKQSHLYDDNILLQGQFNSIKRNFTMGAIPSPDYEMAVNKIRIALIDLVNNLSPDKVNPGLIKEKRTFSAEDLRATRVVDHNAVRQADIGIKDLKIVRKLSETSLWETLLVTDQKADYVIKKISKLSPFYNYGLDYSRVTINSPNIALPVKVLEDDFFRYEFLPYSEGWTLKEIIRLNKGNICGRVLKSWFYELLHILKVLHEHNPPIIHRDIKPDNILVLPKTYEFVLLDLTSAVFFESNATYDSLGTEGYVAPEALKGQPELSSDLYSLAATVYEMNKGVQPPSLFDRERGVAETYLNLVPREVELLYHLFFRVYPNERPISASEALEVSRKVEYATVNTEIWAPNLMLPDETVLIQRYTDGFLRFWQELQNQFWGK